MNNTEFDNAYGMEVIKKVLSFKIKTMGWYGLMSLLAYVFGVGGRLGHDVDGDWSIIYPATKDPVEKELAKMAEIEILNRKL